MYLGQAGLRVQDYFWGCRPNGQCATLWEQMPQPTPIPDTEPSEVRDNPLVVAQRRAEDAERALREMRRAVVHRVDPEPRSMMGRAMQTRTGQLGALAGAIAVVMVPCSSIVTAWMDTTKLRAELAEERKERRDADEAFKALRVDERFQSAGGRLDALDAWRNLETERMRGREDAICRAGQQVPWRVDLTCRKGR